jgi:hypothetical protein
MWFICSCAWEAEAQTDNKPESVGVLSSTHKLKNTYGKPMTIQEVDKAAASTLIMNSNMDYSLNAPIDSYEHLPNTI